MWKNGVDFYDRLMQAQTNADRWRIANEEMASLGASGLNVGEVELETQKLLWMKSTMSEAFLTEYVAQRFDEVDIFVTGIAQPDYPALQVTGTLKPSEDISRKALDFNWTTRDLGYSFGYAMRFAGSTPKTGKTVVFCCSENLSEFDPEQLARIRHAATGIAAFTGPPEAGDDYLDFSAAAFPVQLTSREKQALALLAAGYLNARIAHEMEIAEVTVRKTFLSARQKLGAKTREEALAIALRSGLLEF